MKGPYIRTSARVMAILQLCLAFSTFLWIISGPFWGEYVGNKALVLLFQKVMGNREIPGRPQRDWARFQQLSEGRRVEIERAYGNLEEQMSRSFGNKCRDALAPRCVSYVVFCDLALDADMADPFLFFANYVVEAQGRGHSSGLADSGSNLRIRDR